MMKQIAAAVLLVLLLAHPADLSSCGPFFPTAIFTGQYAPDNERAFYSGQLGIVQRTYARRYLAMAYRTLSGEPLMPAQVDTITDLERRYRTSDVDGAVKAWLGARQQVPGVGTMDKIEVYRRTGYFTEVPICGADAFLAAKNTLSDYIQRYNATGAETRNWLNAQDEVFTNCGGTPSQIPDPAPAGSDEFVMSDREYQIAAANFYSGHYDIARAEWTKIAADANSRWHVWPPYLIARSYLREANYELAAKQLKQMLADPVEKPLHRQAGLLLDWAMAKLDPGAQLVDLSRRLMEPNPVALGHDLSDYTFIWDQLLNGSVNDYQPGLTQDQRQALFNARLAKLKSAVLQSDLSTWVAGYSSNFPLKPDEVLARWRATKSVAWLLAAAPSPEVETALRAVPADSPAYATARSNLAVMLTNENKNAEAAEVLEEALQHRFDLSSMNQFHAERMKVAESFEVFLANAPREVAKVGSVDEEPKDIEPEYLFDTDAAFAFNEALPLSLWLRAAKSDSMTTNLKTNIAQAGWVRSVLIGKDVQPFADVLAAVKPEYAAQLGTFAKQSGAEREFAEIFWMLHHPELGTDVRADLPRITKDGKIDDYRDNWWCEPGHDPFGGSPQPRPVAKVHFLDAEQQHDLETEKSELTRAGSAAAFLPKKCVEWVQAHALDPRNAEALALAVKTSRFGCSVDPTYVERAFRLLHTKYPNSEWAKKTPYWFK